MAALRNIVLVLLVYLPALLMARFVLPPDGLRVFAILALLGVDWAVVDAVGLAGLKSGAARRAAETCGVLAASVLTIVVVLL